MFKFCCTFVPFYILKFFFKFPKCFLLVDFLIKLVVVSCFSVSSPTYSFPFPLCNGLKHVGFIKAIVASKDCTTHFDGKELLDQIRNCENIDKIFPYHLPVVKSFLWIVLLIAVNFVDLTQIKNSS